MSKNSIDEERKRHDRAVEQLASAREAFEKRRIRRLDFINKQLKKQNHSVKTFEDVDEAMHEYSLIVGGKELSPIGPEPTLKDFYNPSKEQKNREIIFIIMGMCGASFLYYKWNTA